MEKSMIIQLRIGKYIHGKYEAESIEYHYVESKTWVPGV